MDYKDLGSRIRKCRIQKGWTQEDLGKLISVSTSFVGHIERGSRKASLATIVSISNALLVRVDYLLSASLDSTVIGPTPARLNAQQAAIFKEIISSIEENLIKWKE